MLSMALGGWLIAAAPGGVEVQLQLEPVEQERVELALCLRGNGQRVDYRLIVRARGLAGTSQTSQGGQLTLSDQPQCPLRNRLGISPGAQLDAELQWSVDGVEQPPLQRSYPDRREA